MDPESIPSVIRFLEASGPYGLVLVLAWTIWFLNEKKERALRQIYDKVIDLSEKQTAAITKMEAALTALKDTLNHALKR